MQYINKGVKMKSSKELFLAVLMTENKSLVGDIENVANNENVDVDLLNSYRSQAETNVKLVSLSLVTKLYGQDKIKGELVELLARIKEQVKGLDDARASRLLG